jgi:hypothetical protein
MVDDDCDGLVDCADPDCANVFPCMRASKDPTLILYGSPGGLDRIMGHAKLTMGPTDLTTFPVSILLSNGDGTIYSDGIPAHSLSNALNPSIYRFHNTGARSQGGMYDVKIKKNHDGKTYTFSFTSYGDLSRARNAKPNMRLQFYIGDDPDAARDGRVFITLDKPWTPTAKGWRAPKDH